VPSRSRSWNHQVYRLDEKTIDRYDRFGVTCATGKCRQAPTHATRWDYVTGRSGRVSDATRHVCTVHGEKFAAKHALTIGDPRPERPHAVATAVAAMTAGTVYQVRVHNPHGVQWYLEERRSGSGLLATGNRWLAGVPGDATLDQAVTEAETLLARTNRLVPAGQWQRSDRDASAQVIPAQRHDDWIEQPWDLTVSCDGEGMWTLTRILHDKFAPIVDQLGNHNMRLDRALRVATDLLAADHWVTFSDRWATYNDDTAGQGAWHPDQADPARWRSAPGVADRGDSTMLVVPGVCPERRDQTTPTPTGSREMDTDAVPDIGDLFEYDGHTFRVSGWLKPAARRLASRDVGPDRCPLVFCARDEAVYLSGSGVCGVIVRVTDVEVTGRVDWSEESFARAHKSAELLIGREVF
jgi:hypothetical protein